MNRRQQISGWYSVFRTTSLRLLDRFMLGIYGKTRKTRKTWDTSWDTLPKQQQANRSQSQMSRDTLDVSPDSFEGAPLRHLQDYPTQNLRCTCETCCGRKPVYTPQLTVICLVLPFRCVWIQRLIRFRRTEEAQDDRGASCCEFWTQSSELSAVVSAQGHCIDLAWRCVFCRRENR